MISFARAYCIFILAIFVAQLFRSEACNPSFLLKLRQNAYQPEGKPEKFFNASEVHKEYLQQCHCGTRPGKAPRISGGEVADRYEFPWQAALVYRNTRIPFCAGTLINNWYVLTAAHCVLNLPKILISSALNANAKPEEFLVENDFQVLLNAYQLTPLNQLSTVGLYRRLAENFWDLEPEIQEQDLEEGTLRFDVSQRIFHRKFVSEYRNFGFDYDVALLRLKKPVNLAERNAPVPICLPEDTQFDDYEGLKPTTIGWGRTDFRDFGSGSPLLQKIELPIYTLQECSDISRVPVSSRFICAGYHTKTKDIGKTDSGGPLIINKNKKAVQIGIVSWGAGEKEGSVASAFTRISAFLPWIYSKMKSSDIMWCSESEPSKPISNKSVGSKSKSNFSISTMTEDVIVTTDTDTTDADISFITTDTNEWTTTTSNNLTDYI